MGFNLNLLPVSADENHKEREIWFLTDDIPTSAVEYGAYYFSTYSKAELYDLSFTDEEINNLYISYPITAYEYNEVDSPCYYFPVLSGNDIIAMLTMVDVEDGTYSITFGKSDVAQKLNQVRNNFEDASALLITNEAMYTMDSKNELVTVDMFYSSDKSLQKAISDVKIKYNQIESLYDNRVCITNNYLAKYEEKKSAYSSYSTYSVQAVSKKDLSVPIVPNGTNASYPKGYCWASAVASVVKYRKYLPMSAIQLRDSFVSNSQYTGTTADAYNIMKSYIGNSVTLSTNGMLTYNTIKSCIDSNKPIFSGWLTSDFKSGHAMVVCGYYYDSSMSGPSTERATVMDPNKATYQSIGLYPTFKYRIGNDNFSWCNSVY
ncbi:MAG TPA: papain-like cysteine protease family protein [Ruminococcus sp.]